MDIRNAIGLNQWVRFVCRQTFFLWKGFVPVIEGMVACVWWWCPAFGIDGQFYGLCLDGRSQGCFLFARLVFIISHEPLSLELLFFRELESQTRTWLVLQLSPLFILEREKKQWSDPKIRPLNRWKSSKCARVWKISLLYFLTTFDWWLISTFLFDLVFLANLLRLKIWHDMILKSWNWLMTFFYYLHRN